MTGSEYRAALKALGLQITVGAPELFDVHERTSKRWAAGEIPVPQAVAICLRLMLKMGLNEEYVLQLLKAKLRVPADA